MSYRHTRRGGASLRHAIACALGTSVAVATQAQTQTIPASHTTVTPRVTVTGTREKELLNETPASVGAVEAETVQKDRPTHPAAILGQVPGVSVAVTNGEGHSTAIRQPFTTNPVYLFLEDGIPIRSTGFFNHNALYEINIPGSGGIEVIKGPGTALYGSDAIGGIVNVLTPTPPTSFEAYLSPDIGSHGWRRLQAGVGDGYTTGAWRGDLNLTHTDGWREKTKYDRQSGSARYDTLLAGGDLKTVFAFSSIDQQTGANSALIEEDYRNNPTKNYLPIAYRKVDALRLSTAWDRVSGDTLLSLTGYVRKNRMELLATFLLNSDPTVSESENTSVGLLARVRKDFPGFMRARVIAGVDLDYSPGGREEDRLNVTPNGTGASRTFTTYTVGTRVYDYDVTFKGVSPYVHTEFSPHPKVRVVAGLRYDSLSYEYDNSFGATPIQVPGAFPGLRFYAQAEDTKRDFSRTSPKFGATFDLGSGHAAFVSYNHGFRAPSESQIFRPSAGTTAAAANVLRDSALGLQPIRAIQSEVGLRGDFTVVNYDVSVYRLVKKDDILTFRDTTTNFTQSVNAGETSHEGIEIGVGAKLGPVRLDLAYSNARHKYEQWVTSGGDFTGKEIESAPRVLANARVTWTPWERWRLVAEATRIGEYWMDAANTTKYPGHTLVNVRANVGVTKNVELFASITNVADKRYADSSSISSATPVYSPGLPRTYYGGVRLQW